jgi:D-glycero-D-manno-heptose 1,7-bisphosphate phosphatase
VKTNPNKTPAVFLDKDGTLIEDVPYNVDPALIKLAPGAAEGVALLADAGFALVVVSNQSGVARGLFEETALAAVEERIRELMTEAGALLAGFYYCPHHPLGLISRYQADCTCRKPAPGMILRAADELGLDLPRSWLIGDILDDIAAGNRAGCKTVLLDNGHETVWRWTPERKPTIVAPDMAAAARSILAASGRAIRSLETIS